jgi:hypothetical protein
VLIPLPDIIADQLQVCHRAMSLQGIALPCRSRTRRPGHRVVDRRCIFISPSIYFRAVIPITTSASRRHIPGLEPCPF